MLQNRVLITGASSGIGEALAFALARPGAHLTLVARDADALAAVAAACEKRGACAATVTLDVTDADALARAVEAAAPLDLVFANAGIAHGTGPDGLEHPDQVRRILAVNVDGVINTALPAIAAMLAQPPGPDGVRGRIAVISSIAAFVAYPKTPTYCASKAAVDVWTMATAANLVERGVLMTSFCPGFVSTRMTAVNDFSMPGLLDADTAARRILDGLRRNRRRVVFPRWMAYGTRLVGVLPTRAREGVIRRQPPRIPPVMSP